MVGIVVVSHSAGLARGVADLAREMGGADVVVEVAGGTSLPEDPLGTDAVLVAKAIEKAFSSDGVLVLMDLGSAVLSAETALDMLDPEIAARVLLCDAPLVEGAVSAAIAARLGVSLAEVAAEARAGLDGKRQHLGDHHQQQQRRPRLAVGASVPAEAEEEVRLTVGNRLGLHARPAARIVLTAGRFDADVAVTNLTTGRGPASARSVNGLATLGVSQGHEIAVRASGPEAAAALRALVALAAEGFGDNASAAERTAPAAAGPARDATFTGMPASPGIAFGAARHVQAVVPDVSSGPPADPSAEWSALQSALEAVRGDLRAAQAALTLAAGGREAAILDVHLLFLDDEALLGPARRAVVEEGAGAAEAWRAAFESVAATYRSLDEPYLRARAADVTEVGNRVLLRLRGHGPVTALIHEPGILVTTEIAAGDLAVLDPALVTGLAAARGGPLSHGALLARALGIPAVTGLGEAVLAVAEGTPLVVDGAAGALYVDPSPDTVARLAARQADSGRRQAGAAAAAGAAAVTRDGIRILVEANAGSANEAPAILASGADGVGLLRTEFLFLDRETAPGEDEQYRAYLDLASLLDGRPVVVRTLDAGADKPLPWLPGGQEPEANPALGRRGLRLGLSRTEVLVTQIRAVLRVAATHPVRLMFPMVTTVEEFRRAKALVAEAAAGLRSERCVVPDTMMVGIMVEVPAAALAAVHFAPEVDFLSIGTNDLTQYVMAVDRGNSSVAALGDGLDPAVLHLIRSVVLAGTDAHVRVAVCGALAADSVAVPVLIGLGVTGLSVPPAAVPSVKQAVRDVDAARAADLARRALSLESAAAVRRLAAPAGP